MPTREQTADDQGQDQGFQPEQQTLWGFALYTTGLLGALIAFTELLSSGTFHWTL